MNLYPTRPAAHVAIAGACVVVVGVISQNPAIIGWGGALLVALALARSVTLVSVARIRAAGFEMLWTGSKRMMRTPRGGAVELEAEVRNRDTLAARYVKLRAVASSQLRVELDPPEGEVTAGGRLKVKVRVETPRVGLHGLHGLALEVQGAPGLFEVPLTFANPFGVEVLPRPFHTFLTQARGGRSHLVAVIGRPGRLRGDGTELRELRELQPGDPFRRIAWKASARRGKLMVREFEREERDIVWVVLDASVELWSGVPGRAPLDLAIDEAASMVTHHISRGDRVGLFVVASTTRAVVYPESGPNHAVKLSKTLLEATHTYDHERSDLDELDVGVRVLEHLRPLDPKGLSDVRRGDLDKLAARADAMRPRAPFSVTSPQGKSNRERILRRYLAAFGLESPPRGEPERKQTAEALFGALAQIARAKPRPSILHVIAQIPDDGQVLRDRLGRLVRSRTRVTWSSPAVEPALAPPYEPTRPAWEDPDQPARPQLEASVAPIASDAVRWRAAAAERRSEETLRRVGVKVLRLRHAHVPRPE